MIERIKRCARPLEGRCSSRSRTNVLYLTGFDSSNAALLVDRDRAALFADFRYAEVGRSVEGVEFVERRGARC